MNDFDIGAMEDGQRMEGDENQLDGDGANFGMTGEDIIDFDENSRDMPTDYGQIEFQPPSPPMDDLDILLALEDDVDKDTTIDPEDTQDVYVLFYC